MNAKLNQLIDAQQQQQQVTLTPPPSPPQIQPRPPTPTENNANPAMEVQVPVTTEANSAEPETIDVARTSEPAPKKRALEYARERRVDARLDCLEERPDRLEQTMKANYETLSQAIKATNDRLDATNACLDTLVTPVHDHELLPNGAIEHSTVEIVTGKRKRRESTFIINVYSNPKHFQQKFRTLVHKAQQLAGSNVTLQCGDFNAQHTAWGVSTHDGEGPQSLLRNNGRRLPIAKRHQRTYEKRNVVAARHKPGPRFHKQGLCTAWSHVAEHRGDVGK
ncbi:hypothetical protein MRX96_043365 [Rhipicephalus microplus]